MKRSNASLRYQGIDTIFIAGHFEDHVGLFERLRERSIEPYLFTSPAQAPLFGDAMPEGAYIAEKLDENFADWFRERATPSRFLVLSFGARWIFPKETITCLFDSRIVNFHGTRLPLDRGGGGFSWRIMRGDRIGSLLAHMVEPGIDTGSVLRQCSYLFPGSCRKPIDYISHYRQRLLTFVMELIDDLSSGVTFELGTQPDYLSHYLPRLDSAVNASINWSWEADAICRFILAFDDPYPGAMTKLNDQIVHVKDTQLHCGEVPSHPFEKGLVIRHEGDWIVVAAGGQSSLVVETVLDGEGRDCLAQVKVGDRFHTPVDMLDESFAVRARVGPV